MTTIKTVDLKRGMELGAPVMDTRGRILFNAGIGITDKHIKALKAWGITEVTAKERFLDITYDEGNESEVIDEKLLENVKQEIDFLFQKTDRNDPIVSELHRLAIARKINEKVE